MRYLVRSAVALLCVIASGCGSGSNGSPTSPTSATRSFRISGTLSNAVTGRRLAGVQVSVVGSAERITTDASGSYTVSGQVASGSSIVVVAELGGYWPRRQTMDASASSVDLDLLPQGDGFDLRFFDEVLRSGGSTQRLTRTPSFTIYPQLFECVLPANGACGTVNRCGGNSTVGRAVADLDPSFVSETQRVIREDLPAYTGGALDNPEIRIGAMRTPGSSVNFSEMRTTNDIAFVFSEGLGCAGTADGIGTTGLITIMPSSLSGIYLEFRRRTLSHEMAHMLGFNHVVTRNLVNCSIMGGDCSNNLPDFFGRPSPADMLHGRILYRRPVGSTSPDTNPPIQ